MSDTNHIIAPPLVHVSHAKAGSTWLYQIFHDAYADRVQKRVGGDIKGIQCRPQDIHSAIFCNYRDFLSIKGAESAQCFFVMRDIRDALLSLYFSLRYSHVENRRVVKWRKILSEMSEDDGIFYVFKNRSKQMRATQASWIKSGKPVYRYEDLFESEGMLLLDILKQVGFEHDPVMLSEVIQRHTFEKRFNRKPGVVDDHSHGRRGLPGGWQDYLTPELEKLIDTTLAEHLELTSYLA